MPDSILLYLDPGTGATLAQIALAGTAGIAAAAKMRMNRLRRKPPKETPIDQDGDPVESSVEEVPTAE